MKNLPQTSPTLFFAIVGLFDGLDFGLNLNFVSSPKANQLGFVVAQLFLAMGAGKASVGVFRKPLGMAVNSQLPTE